MQLRFCSLLASGLGLAPYLVSGSPIVPHYFRAVDVSRAVSPKQVQNDLGRTLSKGSLIFGPSHPAFAEATERWSTRSMPDDIQVVIEVAQESDVAKIVSPFAPDCKQVSHHSSASRSNIVTRIALTFSHILEATVLLVQFPSLEVSKSTCRSSLESPSSPTKSLHYSRAAYTLIWSSTSCGTMDILLVSDFHLHS